MYRFLSKQNLKKRKKIAINQQVLFLIKYYNKTSRQNKNEGVALLQEMKDQKNIGQRIK